METYLSGTQAIRMYEHQARGTGPHAAVMVLHGSGGAISYWADRFAPALARLGVSVYAPHYFDKTGTQRATAETILDGQHFAQWLAAIRDGMSFIASRPSVDAKRIAVLGISLGGYLSLALALEDPRVRAVIELSGGIPPGWENRVTQAMAPVLVVHGLDDHIVPATEARKLISVLERHGIPHQAELLPGETHWFSPAAQPKVLMACAGFLARHL